MTGATHILSGIWNRLQWQTEICLSLHSLHILLAEDHLAPSSPFPAKTELNKSLTYVAEAVTTGSVKLRQDWRGVS